MIKAHLIYFKQCCGSCVPPLKNRTVRFSRGGPIPWSWSTGQVTPWTCRTFRSTLYPLKRKLIKSINIYLILTKTTIISEQIILYIKSFHKYINQHFANKNRNMLVVQCYKFSTWLWQKLKKKIHISFKKSQLIWNKEEKNGDNS